MNPIEQKKYDLARMDRRIALAMLNGEAYIKTHNGQKRLVVYYLNDRNITAKTLGIEERDVDSYIPKRRSEENRAFL